MSQAIQLINEAAHQELVEVEGRAHSQLDALETQRPSYMATAAGRDFTVVGRRIAEALERVHDSAFAQLNAVHEAALTARKHSTSVTDADEDVAAALERTL